VAKLVFVRPRINLIGKKLIFLNLLETPGEVGSTAIRRLPFKSARDLIFVVIGAANNLTAKILLTPGFNDPGKGPSPVTVSNLGVNERITKGEIAQPLPTCAWGHQRYREKPGGWSGR